MRRYLRYCFQLHVDHDDFPFNGHREGLDAGVGLGRVFDRDVIRLDAHAMRVEDRLPGGDVELPAVPGAFDDLALTRVDVLVRPGGDVGADDAPLTQRRALMWA